MHDPAQEFGPVIAVRKAASLLQSSPSRRQSADTIGTVSIIDLDAFGYNIENRHLVAALEQHARTFSNLRLIEDDVISVEPGNETVMVALKGWKDVPEKIFGGTFKAGSISAEISPELLGVGYIIGPRIGSIMCAGGVLSYLVLIPMIKFFGGGLASPLAPGTATALYSRSDGVVDWRACVDPHAEAVEVDSSHCGMSVHPDVYRVLGRALDARREAAWNG